jgi:hypothetical protein
MRVGVMKRPSSLPKLYRALSDISEMRNAVNRLDLDFKDADAVRFLSRLESVEHIAFELLEQVELRLETVSH